MSMSEAASKIAELKKNGMTIVKPSDELMNGLREIGATMLSDWKKSAGADGETILNAYYK